MPTEPAQEDDRWRRIWKARLEALRPILGDSGDIVYHARLPIFLGGDADVVPFPNYIPGHTFVTADLTGEDAGQPPNRFGNYELMICTQTDFKLAPDLVSKLGKYSLTSVLQPGATMDLETYFGDTTLRGLFFTHPTDPPPRFEIEGQPCGLLLCIGITKSEMAFKHANGSGVLLERLRAAGVFPYTIPDRASVI